MCWMPIHACVLLIAVATLFEELANRDPIVLIAMEKLAILALTARVVEPVDANFLLQLRLIRHLIERLDR